MSRRYVLALVIPFLLALVWSQTDAQVFGEFNWIPSGSIDVGDSESENDANYRSTGHIMRTNLGYADGARPPSIAGRRTTEESFTVNVVWHRLEPASHTLVIRRRVDTALEPVELTVTIDDEEYAKWLRPQFEGERRFADVLFAIPTAVLMKDPENPRTIKRQIMLTISAKEPYDSYRYDFFVTRDWSLLSSAPLGPVAERPDAGPESAYLDALVKEGDHRWQEAIALYTQAAEGCRNPELARCIRRRIRRCRYGQAAPKVVDTAEEKHFAAHYALGQYCAANGFWNEARAEYAKAVEANAVHPEATYNLAEAMEYCRMPVERYAPLMERAGALYNRTDTNDITVLCAINTYEAWTRPSGRISKQISKASLDGLFRDWRIVEQMVYGASRGAWRLNTTYRLFTEEDPSWVVHHGWMYGPPAEAIPKRGLYDHTMAFAEYNSSHACGIDCGPAWSGCCQIGPRRGWQVILHEWNHQFHWTSFAGEQGRGNPATHESNGLGKQPIVNMGSAHRSGMRYYLTPAQYRRIEPSDPDIPQTHIRSWALYGPLDAPALERATGEDILAELRAKDLATDAEIEQIKEMAERDNKSLVEAAKTWFYASRQMDLVKAVENEAVFGPTVQLEKWHSYTDPDGGRVDLAALYPNAAPKSYAYAHTYVWSPNDREVRVWYGFHDGLRVWHNTRMIRDGQRTYAGGYFKKDPECVDMVAGHLCLKKGWNSLLCKIERCGSLDNYGIGPGDAWGFSVNLVNYDNSPVEGLKYQAEVPDGHVNIYTRPEVGRHYRWDDVKDDYTELLPQLTVEDFRAITGIPELVLVENAFLAAIPKSAVLEGANAVTIEELRDAVEGLELDGEEISIVNFLDKASTHIPRGAQPGPLDAVKQKLLKDVTLNNFLNFEREGAGALRYIENGEPRDLLFIRPEYFEEYLALVDDANSGLPGRTRDRILGYWFIPRAAYWSTGNRTWRAVIVAKTYLGDQYPTDEQDILAVPQPPATE